MIKDRIKELKKVEWRKIKPLQPDNSKVLMNYDAIEKSILKHGFSMPFFGWENKGNVHCIDGHSRLEILSNLENVPETLPVILIDAKDKKEAQEILIEVFNQKHNPFDFDEIRKQGSLLTEQAAQMTRPYIIGVGNLTLHKGFHKLLQAFAQSHYSGDLVLVDATGSGAGPASAVGQCAGSAPQAGDGVYPS